MSIVKMIGLIGIRTTLQAVIYDLKLRGDRQEREIALKPNEDLKFPIYLTNTFGDLGPYMEIIINRALALPELTSINGKPIVDVGANIGVSTAFFATKFPKSPILAIEASKRNQKRLLKNVKPYGSKISVEGRAFANTFGKVGLVNPEASRTKRHTTYLFSGVDNDHPRALLVDVITPAEIVDWSQMNGGRIGVLKIDIEGAEKAIFLSPRMYPLLRLTNILVIETHDGNVPGSTTVVNKAAKRAGLFLTAHNGVNRIYTRDIRTLAKDSITV
jgi:FkbM family methyltransferase